MLSVHKTSKILCTCTGGRMAAAAAMAYNANTARRCRPIPAVAPSMVLIAQTGVHPVLTGHRL